MVTVHLPLEGLEWLKNLWSKSPTEKLRRGGSWDSEPKDSRFTHRYFNPYELISNKTGFRVVVPKTV